MSIRIAAIDGGIHQTGIFSAQKDIDILYAGNPYLEILIFRYDVLIISFHTDRIRLYRLKKSLDEFIKKGGILIILGATDESHKNWIPYCQWNSKYAEEIEINLDIEESESGNVSQIFDGIKDKEDLKYHATYYSHGTLTPQVNQQNLVTDENGLPIMFIIRDGIEGAFFATTLDPDYHSVMDVPGRTQNKTDKTKKNANKLLINIIGWARSEASKRQEKWLNRLRISFFKKVSLYFIIHIIIGIILPITISLLLIYFSIDRSSTEKISIFGIVISAISIAGTIATYVGNFKQSFPMFFYK